MEGLEARCEVCAGRTCLGGNKRFLVVGSGPDMNIDVTSTSTGVRCQTESTFLGHMWNRRQERYDLIHVRGKKNGVSRCTIARDCSLNMIYNKAEGVS